MPWTLAMLGAGLVLVGIARRAETRPRELGEVSLLPSTALMALGLVLAVIALAHLAGLLTGVPLRGRAMV